MRTGYLHRLRCLIPTLLVSAVALAAPAVLRAAEGGKSSTIVTRVTHDVNSANLAAINHYPHYPEPQQ